jgi:glutathione reductase (NADPH)
MSESYDLVVIGAGSGGVRASRFAADRGASVLIIESTYLGGTCINAGCIPKKLLSYAAHYRNDFSDAEGFGYDPHPATFRWPRLIAAKDKEIARLNEVYARILREAGVTLMRGHARIADAHTVMVGKEHIKARSILVATGSRALKPPIPGAELGITSDDAFHLETLPDRILILGAGYIAVEFASIFHGLGANTTLMFRGEAMLRAFDHDIACHLAEAMAEKGVVIKPSMSIARLARNSHCLEATLSDGSTLMVDCVMFATGRVPNTIDLGLEQAGVELGINGAVKVNDRYQSSVPSIYAIGDVIDRMQLTPVALREGMTLADELFGEGLLKTSYENVPTAVFSHPNVGSVGLGEKQAIMAGHTVRIFKSTFTALRHTLSGNSEKTFMKIVVDAISDVVLGVHMCGPDAGEVIQGFAVALNCGARKSDFDRTLGIHPTLAEEFVTMRASN